MRLRCTLALVVMGWLVAACKADLEPATIFGSAVPSVEVRAPRQWQRHRLKPTLPEPTPLDLSTTSAAERQELATLVSTVLEHLQHRRYKALASVVHPVRGLTIEEAQYRASREGLARLGARAMPTIIVNCYNDGTLEQYVEKLVLGGLDLTKPRPIRYDRVTLRDAGTQMEEELPRVVVQVTDRESDLGWVHQVVLYVDQHERTWYLAGIFTTDHYACDEQLPPPSDSTWPFR